MPAVFRILEIALFAKRAGGGTIWGEMSPPNPPLTPAGLVHRAGVDPVGSVWGGVAGVRGRTLDVSTAASGKKGPIHSAVRIRGFGACPRPWWVAGGRRGSFVHRCAEVSTA